jgi:hypothetical protein
MSAYEDLVRLGDGLMRGQLMLLGWKNMHPEQHYVAEHFDLYEHMDDPAYKERVEVFDSWYENPLDLPGHWYLRAIRGLFKENRLAKGEFVGLGRRLDLKSIACPLLSPRRRERRHHDQGAGFRGGEPRRNPERSNREEAGPRRTRRSLHGLAHAEGDVADDRAVATAYGLRLTLGRRGLALVDPVGGTTALRRSGGAPRCGSGVAFERAAFEKGVGRRSDPQSDRSSRSVIADAVILPHLASF